MRFWLAIGTILGIVLPARGELSPDEVAIVAMRQSRDSREIAQYYAKSRGIPLAHICLLEAPPQNSISRGDWERAFRAPIRRWLTEKGLASQIRCIVTTWDVPYKIGKQEPNTERIEYLRGARIERVGKMANLIHRVDSLLRDSPPATATPHDDITPQELSHHYDQAAAELRSRISQTGRADADNGELNNLSIQAKGRAALLKWASLPANATLVTGNLKEQIDIAQGMQQGLQAGLVALLELRETAARDAQVVRLMDLSAGYLGTLEWIDQELNLQQRNETYASFDSELALIWWPDYPLVRWVKNTLHYSADGSDLRTRYHTLMVARLEAPTVELTRKLIDTAAKVEQTGLAGKVYLDARGFPYDGARNKRGSYGDYDQCLRRLRDLLTAQTDLTVRLDNQEQLFQEGDCPEAALYCGWYSLKKYIDAFQWQQGAVAYHLASGEAITLRDPNSQVWCKRMLEEGVCATLGPVHEPYLAAFPRPDEFFSLLLSGEYSLAECYARSNPFNSWVMTLIGDPLYNPFKRHPLIKLSSLPDELKGLGEQVKTPAPGRKDGEYPAQVGE